MTLNFIDKWPVSERDDSTSLPPVAGIDAGLWQRLSGYSVISFDIFETLLHREGVFRPIDLFLEMGDRAGDEIGISALDFARLRIRSERDARSSMARRNGHEVRLSEIYDRLNALLPTTGRSMVSDRTLRYLEQIETETELSHLKSLPSVAELYRWAIAAKKTVVLVSDFYSPRSFVEAALRANGFDAHHALFVSSELDLTKHHGDLYAHVCQALNVSPRDIVHLGDNSWSDGSRALQSGIACMRINNPVNLATARWQLDWREPSPRISSAVHARQAERMFGAGLILRQPDQMRVLERVGQECLGPLLLGLSSWLYAEADSNTLPAIHFCARDGLIMKKAFDLYQKRHGRRVDSRYLKISRQVIYRARAVSEPESAAALFAQNWANLTAGDALSRWGLDPKQFENQIREVGFTSAEDGVAIGDGVGTKRFAALFNICRDELHAANTEHAKLFEAYLMQEGVTDASEVLIVDIGWHGTLQKGLFQTLRANGWVGELSGRYLGLFLDEARLAEFDAAGYLFSKDGTPRANALRASPSLVELLHTAGHGSTAGYGRSHETGQIETFFEKRPEEVFQYAERISQIQSAALDFMEEMLAKPGLGPDVLYPADAFRGLDRLLNRPSADEVAVLGELKIAANYGTTAKSVALKDRSKEGYQLWNHS